jgi:hypothetical protein
VCSGHRIDQREGGARTWLKKIAPQRAGERAVVLRLLSGVAATSARRSFPRHAFGKDFALDDLVSRLALHHPGTGEFLAALGAFAVAVGTVLDNALDQALDQTTATALVVFVEQGPAGGTVDGDGADVFAGHV